MQLKTAAIISKNLPVVPCGGVREHLGQHKSIAAPEEPFSSTPWRLHSPHVSKEDLANATWVSFTRELSSRVVGLVRALMLKRVRADLDATLHAGFRANRPTPGIW